MSRGTTYAVSEPMRLVSYIKNPIAYHQSDGREYLTIDGIGRLKAATKGFGIFYSWAQLSAMVGALNCQFDLRQTTQAQYSTDKAGKTIVELGAQPRPPCTGIRTSTGEGFIISPAIKFEPIQGQTIAVMLIAPRFSPHTITVEKAVLAIPKEESQVIVEPSGGELRCSGTILGRSKTTHIILNRNPRLPMYRDGFDQTLAELKGQGQIRATWKPTAQTFEELILAFYPFSVGISTFSVGIRISMSLESVARYLDAPELEDSGEFRDYVIGDGPGVEYSLRVETDRGLGRHVSDETRLTVV